MNRESIEHQIREALDDFDNLELPPGVVADVDRSMAFMAELATAVLGDDAIDDERLAFFCGGISALTYTSAAQYAVEVNSGVPLEAVQLLGEYMGQVRAATALTLQAFVRSAAIAAKIDHN